MVDEKELRAAPPVDIRAVGQDSVSHSLAVISTVYHYNLWVFDCLRDYIGPRVLEVGAGVGTITQFLLNQESVTCLEPFRTYYDYLSHRFREHGNVHVYPLAIQETPSESVPAGQFDSAICINVLEHIEDHVDALRRMRQLVRPGGRVIVFVPSLPIIYGDMDRAMGHYRRYTLRSLRRVFVEAGIRPRRGHYVNMVGALGWWWQGRFRKKATLSESATRFFDRLVPFLSAAERIMRPFFGQSVLLVGSVDQDG